MPAKSAHGGLGQKDQDFAAILDYTARFCLKMKQKGRNIDPIFIGQ